MTSPSPPCIGSVLPEEVFFDGGGFVFVCFLGFFFFGFVLFLWFLFCFFFRPMPKESLDFMGAAS